MSTLEVITLPSGAVSTLCTSAIACTFLLKDARLLICDCWGFATNQAAAPSRSRWNTQLFKERKGEPGGFALLILWMGSQDCTSDVAESILLRDKCDQGESVAVKQNSDHSVFISRKYKHGKTDGIVAKSFRLRSICSLANTKCSERVPRILNLDWDWSEEPRRAVLRCDVQLDWLAKASWQLRAESTKVAKKVLTPFFRLIYMST